jgi:hypothetical protein
MWSYQWLCFFGVGAGVQRVTLLPPEVPVLVLAVLVPDQPPDDVVLAGALGSLTVHGAPEHPPQSPAMAQLIVDDPPPSFDAMARPLGSLPLIGSSAE